MTKEIFETALDYICQYDYLAEMDNITPEVTADNMEVSLLFFTKDERIEYGDYLCNMDLKKQFEEELYPTLVKDGFLNAEGKALDSVKDAMKWEVWLNLTDGYEYYAGIHLFDYTEKGMEFIGKSANYR